MALRRGSAEDERVNCLPKNIARLKREMTSVASGDDVTLGELLILGSGGSAVGWFI